MDLFTPLNELPYLLSPDSDVNLIPWLLYSFILSSMFFSVKSLMCEKASPTLTNFCTFLLHFFLMLISELKQNFRNPRFLHSWITTLLVLSISVVCPPSPSKLALPCSLLVCLLILIHAALWWLDFENSSGLGVSLQYCTEPSTFCVINKFICGNCF